MSGIDHGIVFGYLVLILVVGLRLGRGVRGGKDWFLGGRRFPWWAIGMSIVVSDIGAKDIVGLAQDSYRHGWVMANWDWLGCIPAMILAALVFVPYFWAGGFFTVPEYFGRRYNETVRAISTVVWGLFIAGNVAVIFSASTAVITPLLGFDGHETEVLVVTALVVGFYTYFGGLAAVVYTDVLQCLVMIAGMALVLWYGLHHESVGSYEQLRSAVEATHPDHFRLFHPPENPSSFTTFAVVFGLGIVLGPAYWIGNQVIVQRVLGARSLGDARGGVLFGALLKSIFPILLVVPGILALVILPEALSGDQTKEVFPRLVTLLLPPGVRGVVFAALLAGMMGNLDSYLNSASTLWTRDIVRRYLWPRRASSGSSADRIDLCVGRTLTLVFLVAGAAISPWIGRIFETMQWMLSMFQGPSLALLLFGMLWKRTTAAGGVAGISLGLGAAAVLDANKQALFGYENPYLHVAWWSFVISALAILLTSLFTRPHDEERLQGLVLGTPLGSGEIPD